MDENPSDLPGDRRVRRTHAALRSALLDLAERQDVATLSAADVAEAAGVSRSTLYDHYRDVHELAEAACASLVDALVDAVRTPGSTKTTEEGPLALEAFFSSIRDHAGLYGSLLGAQGSARVLDRIHRRLQEAVRSGLSPATLAEFDGDPDGSVDQYSALISGALLGVVLEWLRSDERPEPSQVAALVWRTLARQGNPL